MRSGYNPTRRNRNLGTVKQGHEKRNQFATPAVCHDERVWWEQLADHKKVHRLAAGRSLLFIVEATRTDCFHSVSVDDICHLLPHIPLPDWEGLETFVLRQPLCNDRAGAPGSKRENTL